MSPTGIACPEGDVLLGDVLGIAEGGILGALDGKEVGCTVAGVCVEVDGIGDEQAILKRAIMQRRGRKLAFLYLLNIVAPFFCCHFATLSALVGFDKPSRTSE